MASDTRQSLARVADAHTLRLTHKGRKTGKEYGVTIWFVADGPKLLLPTANRNRNWVKNVMKTPRISVEISGEMFNGNARRLDDGPERQHALALVMRKYWYAAPFMMVARMLFASGLMTDASTGFAVELDDSSAPA